MGLPGEEDWLLRPVIRGMCKYESLIDGTLDIMDVCLMNDALAVKDENDRRYAVAVERARGN